MVNTDDHIIINRILGGDKNAYGILVQRYQKPIFNLMFRTTGSLDQAADLAQEVFIKAYENLERFRPGRKFFPWLYTIGLNHARDFLRKTKNSERFEGRPMSLTEVCDPSGSPEHLNNRLDFQRLETALLQMPLIYREALMLRYHEEQSVRDVAAALQVSQSAAKMRVSRGLEMLRNLVLGEHHANK
jgi:RNA polymerase sigma-70 factor (ECF subfamily)